MSTILIVELVGANDAVHLRAATREDLLDWSLLAATNAFAAFATVLRHEGVTPIGGTSSQRGTTQRVFGLLSEGHRVMVSS